jgi:glycosyltransferase involved in cell wall biosynthesis
MRIVFASHTHLGGTFTVGSHHLARELSRAGHRVAHVSTPITPWHGALSRDPEVPLRYRQFLRPVTDPDGVLGLVPLALVPWPVTGRLPALWRHYGLVSYRWLRARVRRHLGGDPDVLFLDQPKLVGLTRALHPGTVIYRPTDLYRHMPGNASIAAAEALAVSRSRAVVATAGPVAEHVRRISPSTPVFVLPNGVELRHFATPAQRPPEYAEHAARAIYAGALDGRFDVAAVELLAGARPDVEFVLIGPVTPRAGELSRFANVRVLGPRPYAAIPGYFQHADVGLLPLSTDPANAGRSPMKLYECGAAGLPVLARHTDEIAGRGASFVVTYRDNAELVAAFGGLLRDPRPVPVAEIAEHSWEHIAAALLSIATADHSPRTA